MKRPLRILDRRLCFLQLCATLLMDIVTARDPTCPADITKVVPYGSNCASVCWSEATGLSARSDVRVTRSSHQPTSLFNIGRTEVAFQYSTTNESTEECRFGVTVTEACVEGRIDAITRTADGHTYVFVGDRVLKLTADGERIENGYPKPICAVFEGLPSDLDAAVYLPNSANYFFKGVYYWTGTGTYITSSSPERISVGFPGIPTGVSLDAVLMWTPTYRAYFFAGDKYWRYNLATNRVEGVATYISVGWPGIVGPVDAAFEWNSAKSYFFTGEMYWRYNSFLDQADDGYPASTTNNWFGCPGRRDDPPTISAHEICIPGLCSDHEVPACLDGNIDAITHIPAVGSLGRIYLFRGMMVARLTEASGDVDSGFPRPICSVFPGLPADLDAALTLKDTGKTYFFKADLVYRFTGFRMDRGYPRSIDSDFPGIPSNLSAAVVTGTPDDQQTCFFTETEFYKFDRDTGAVAPGYPQSIGSYWTHLPDNLNGALQWINSWTYFFRREQYFRWDFSQQKVADGYPKQISSTWFGCRPLSKRNTCWLRQCD